MVMSNKIKTFLWIWFFVLLANQIFVFQGCFAPYCILAALPHTGVIAFLLNLFFGHKVPENIFNDLEWAAEQASKHIAAQKEGRIVNQNELKSARKQNSARRKPPQNHLKKKGDKYERFVGQQLEDKGELVIYNGFIQDYEDGGVDVASISSEHKTINLIQCKNWENRTLTMHDIQNIYNKLQIHSFDFLNLSSQQIQEQQKKKFDIHKLKGIIENAKKNLKLYTIRKTLYISSDKVVNLEIGEHLTMVNPNIFRYEDMKIVIVRDTP